MIGSFLNVCISRLPAGESIVHPRSRCPGCGTPIAWYDNVPVISWLLLRARCRSCGIRISLLYPLIELTTGVLWMLAFAAFGPTFFALRVAVFATVMLGIAVTDAREFLIPDGFTLFGLAWVLGTAFLVFVVGGFPAAESNAGSWLIEHDGRFASVGQAFLGACAGAGAVAIVGWLGEVALKREAMGFGDLTLMAVVGGAVGPVRALLTVFLGAVLAVLALPLLRLVGRTPALVPAAARGGTVEHSEPAPVAEQPPGTDADESRGHIPFGVFLAPAALVALLWGEALIEGYLRWMYTGSLS
jgi:leader peptidase (prepilin peptidase)/N-methyltransferase